MARKITTLVAPAGTPGSSSGPVGGSSALVPVLTCVGDDEGHGSDQQFDHVTRLVTFEVGVTLTFGSTPNQNCTFYLSMDSGTTFFWQPPRLWTASGQKIKFNAARPITTSSWVIAAVAGSIAGDPLTSLSSFGLPAGRRISATFIVAALSLPPAVMGLIPTYDPGAGGNWPYNQFTTDETQYWDITGISIYTGVAYLSTNTSAIAITFEDLDAAHSPIAIEHIFQGITPIDGTLNFGELIGDYLDSGTPARSGNIAYVRMRVYAINRVDQTTASWSNPAASTLQTDVGGGAGYVDILVAVGGVGPPGELVHVGQAASFSFSSFYDPGFGFCSPGLVTDPAGSLWGPGDFRSAAWFYDCPGPGVITIYASGGNDGGQYCGMKAASVRVGQMLTTIAGASHFVACYVKSTNNGSTNHQLNFIAVWVDGNGSTISTTTFLLAHQYVSNWTFVSGFVTAPAGAASAFFYFGTGASEPSTDEWFIDDLKVEGTILQTANHQTATTAPAIGPVDYSALRALSTIDNSNSYYGRQEAKLTGPGGSNVDLTVSSGGVAQISIEDDTGDNGIHFAFSNSGIAITVLETGVAYSTYSGTMGAAVAANKLIKHGFVVF